MNRQQGRAVILTLIICMSVFSVAGAGLVGAAAASGDDPTVISGNLTYSDESNVSSWRVLAANENSLATKTTDSSGSFSINASENGTYNVWYQQYDPNKPPSENFPRDGKVDMWALGSVNTSTGEDIGDRSIPNGSLLKIRVVNESGDPISNAQVDVSQSANGARASSGGQTNANGQMVLNGTELPGIEVRGNVDIDVHGPSEYKTNFSTLSVSSNRTYTVVLNQKTTVNGTVSAADGSPASNDTVIYKNPDLQTYESSLTNGSGEYSVELRPGYTYKRAFYQGDRSQNDYLTAPADGVPDLYAVSPTTVSGSTTSDITLPEGHNVTIRVVNENGSTVSGANVYLRQQNSGSNAGASFQTNSAGEVTVELAGSVNLNVNPPSGSDLAGTNQEFVADGDKTITVTLPNTVSVSGNVTSADNSLATGYEVVYHTTEEPRATDVGQTGSIGAYSVRVPDNRTYHIDLTQVGSSDVQSFADDGIPDIYAYGFASVGGSNETRNLTVPYGNDLEITVLGPDENPVSNAEVYVRHRKDNRGTGVSGFTNADGQFVIDRANKTGIEVNGTVGVNVNAPSGSGVSDAYVQYTVTSNRSVTIQLEETSTVSGRIVDSSETAVTGYLAELQSFDSSANGFDAFTDGNGTFSGKASQNATYEYMFSQRTDDFSAPNFPKDGIPDVHPLGTVQVGTSNVSLDTEQLPEGHLLNVSVIDPNGDPVEGVEMNIEVHGPETTAYTSGSTNTDGELVLDQATEPGLEANGEVELNVNPTGSQYARTEVQTTLDGNDSITIELEPTVNVTMQVEDADGTAVSGDRIDAYSIDGTDGGGTTLTNESGYAALPVGENGEYNVGFVQVQADREYQPSYPADGVPDIYAIGQANNSSAEFGTVSLPEAHNLTVNVVDTQGNPVDAQVYFNHQNNGADYGRSRQTDSNGAVGVEMVGNVDLYVTPDDATYRDENANVNLTSDQTVEVVVSKGAPITGELKNPDGTNASGWHVEASGQGGSGDTTDQDGQFTIRVEPGQTYDLTYKQTDFDDTGDFPKDGVVDLYAFESVTVDSGGTDVGTKQLPEGHLLNVTVVNESGAELSGLTVDVTAVNGSVSGYSQAASTNEQGQVVLEGAETPGIEVNGTLRLTVEGTNTYAEVSKEVTVTNNSSTEIVMQEPAQVSGRIVYPDNTTQANDTLVHFGSETSDSIVRTTQTDADGRYNFPAPRADDVEITFYQFGQFPDADRFPRDGVVDVYAVEQVDTTGGDVDLGNDTLPKGHVVNVTVYDESGDPVRNASIRISHSQGGFNMSAESPYADGGTGARTDPDGQLHYGGLPNRNYTTPPGIELSGNVSIRVRPPEGDDRFVAETYRRNITVDSERNLTFTLEEKSRVTGQFVDADGRPLENAVTIVSNDQVFEIGAPDADGSFDVGVPSDGDYSITFVQSNGSGNQIARDNVTDLYTTSTVTVNGSTDVGNQTVPNATGVLDIKVEDENGTAVENARVSIGANQTGTARPTFVVTTDAQGYFNIEGQRGMELNGSYVIYVRPPENATQYENTTYTRNVSVTGDMTETFTLQPNVSDGPSASGQVLLPDSSPVAPTTDVLFDGTSDRFAKTGTNGTYATTLPENGTYDVYVVQNGTDEVTPRDGFVDVHYAGGYNISGPTELSPITLPEGYVLNVSVENQDGEPIEGALVGYRPKGNASGKAYVIPTVSDGMAAPRPNTSERGLEVLGNVTIEVRPPENNSAYVEDQVYENVTVTQDESVTVTLTEKRPNLSVDYSVESTEVTPGTPINVSATVTNTGSANGTENVTLTIGNSSTDVVETTTQVSVAPGESRTVTFSETLEEGDWTVEVNELEPTTVSVRPAVSVNVDAPKQFGVGQNKTVYVTVSSVTEGVGTVDLNVSVANGSVVEVTEATTTIGGNDDSSLGAGTEARLIGFNGDTNDSGEVRVAEVVINGSNVGTTTVQVSTVRGLGDESGNQYILGSTGEDTVEVVAVPTVGNKSVNPKDPDNDGTYEDVNGDGTFDLNDVTTLFENSDGEIVNQYAEAFDFNGNGEFDIVDVQALYNEYKNKGGS